MPLSLDTSALTEACARLAPAGPLVLGLSGGGDSMALLCLLQALARQTGRPLHALIIDHALRSDSGAEAALTAARARTLGAQARVLRWDAPRRSQSAARQARHCLLADACRALGADVLFLAHTADDQLETRRMRMSRPGDARRLVAMSELDPSPVWPEGRGLRLARPLLQTGRAALRRYLTDQGVDWIEDPSNEDRRYERVRLRQTPLSPGEAAALTEQCEAARQAEAQLRSQAASLLDRGAAPTRWGGLQLDAAVFAASRAPVAERALELAMLAVSGERRTPPPVRVRSLLGALLAGRSGSAAGAMLTASGLLGRESGAVTGRRDGATGADLLFLRPGETGVFDGRFEITAGAVGLQVEAADSNQGQGSGVPPVFRAGLPRIVTENGDALAYPWSGLTRGGTMTALTAPRLRHLAFPFCEGAWFYDSQHCGDFAPGTGEAGLRAQY